MDFSSYRLTYVTKPKVGKYGDTYVTCYYESDIKGSNKQNQYRYITVMQFENGGDTRIVYHGAIGNSKEWKTNLSIIRDEYGLMPYNEWKTYYNKCHKRVIL